MGNAAARSLFALGLLIGACSTAAATEHSAGEQCPKWLLGRIPPRAAGAADGSDFVRETSALSEAAREAVIAAELRAGNLPSFLRRLHPVTLRSAARDRTTSVTICVMPDYLAIGSDQNFLRIPMALPTALAVADSFGFVLPTRAMVDAIYEQADVRVRPQPLPPTEEMRSTAYYWRHQVQIRGQRLALDAPLGILMAGQKKDLVLTKRLLTRPGRVAIYGWHRGRSRPIQPLSTVHGAGYADYSHGVRLVSAVAYVDGEPRPLVQVLMDPRLAAIVSDEGPLPHPVALMAGAAHLQQVAAAPGRQGGRQGLNRRLAPDVYLGIEPLTFTPRGAGLRLAGDGSVVDWLIVMRRLPEPMMLDRALGAGGPERRDLDRVARRLARFYQALGAEPIAPEARRRWFETEIELSWGELGRAEFSLAQARIERRVGRLREPCGHGPNYSPSAIALAASSKATVICARSTSASSARRS